MKYLSLRDIDTVANALNFSTPDCHVIGGCDVYTTKAAGGDKKLYRNIEHSLESQYESLVRLSASLSPPCRTASDDGRNSEKNDSRKRGRTVDPTSEIDLSRASPFGPLSQITARRTFAYLIATLNASHPDYDFSHILRPSDFRKERSLRNVMHNVDTTLQNLRPRQTAAMNFLSPLSSNSAPSGMGLGGEIWNQNMWKLIDKEMGLRHCEKYSYAPDEDPFDGEEGAIWSMHHFFFNKEKRRVCYLYLRGFSVISHSPVQAATVHRLRPVQRKVSSLSVGEGAGKRASFWLSSDLLQRNVASHDDDDDDDDDDDEMVIDEPGDDEVEVPSMNLDDVRSDLLDGRYSYTIDEEEDYDDDDDSWKLPRHVRGVSEEIRASMDLDL